jgi:hypothetical protein
VDAASKSLDNENYIKAKILNDYRKEFAVEINNKNKIKESEMVKAQKDRETYVKMCNGECLVLMIMI